MKRKCLGRVSVTFALAIMPLVLLTGCKEQKADKATKAYYVISEELDINKTIDKAQEILENNETKPIN
ncbi:MAG TPA: hypothetical protein VJY54_06095 [Lachnospiraceae bacterium]|nr:hypothetical protein [Lachnospiraceae bacterium]